MGREIRSGRRIDMDHRADLRIHLFLHQGGVEMARVQRDQADLAFGSLGGNGEHRGGQQCAGDDRFHGLINRVHFTTSGRLSLWLLNSGAYRHWISAMPVWYWPRSCTRVEYSNT